MTVLFYALVVAEWIPVWSFRYVPTTDGPSHLYNSIVVRDYARPDRHAFRDYFALNPRPVPNWIAPLAEIGLCRCMTPLAAEKALICLYILLFPLSIRYALLGINREAGWLVILAFPLAPNFYLHEGLFNFCFSLAFFFYAVGFWLRHGRHLTVRQTVLFCGLLGCLYFAHLIGFIMAVILIGALIFSRRDWRPRSSGFSGAIRGGVAAMPWVGLSFWFILSRHSHRMIQLSARHSRPWSHRLFNILSWMKSFRPDELAIAALVMLMLAGIAIAFGKRRIAVERLTLAIGEQLRPRRLRFRRSDSFLAVGGIYLIIFLAAPQAAAGGSMIVIRLACFPAFALLLWIAGQTPVNLAPPRLAHRLRIAVIALATGLTLLLLLSHARSYRRINPYLQEFADAETRIPPNRTLLPIYLSDGADVDENGRRLSSGSSPLVEGAAYFAAQRGIVNLDNYEAGVDYFPLQFRKGLDPYPIMIDREQNIHAYETRTGKTVDYVLLWTGGADQETTEARRILRQLRSHYRLIFKSGYSGYARLYERQG